MPAPGRARPLGRSRKLRLRDLSLSTRLMVAMVALVILTAAAVGLLTFRMVSSAIVPNELERLAGRARLLAAELNAQATGGQVDVAALRGSAAVDGIMRATLAGGTDPATGLAATVWRDQLAGLFAATLAANPAYLQMRYVGVAEDGREIVRVDRSGPDGAIRVTPEAELQPKADRPYFQEAIGLAAGQIYVSPIELNQEHGAIETPHVPVLRTAMPVFAADDRPFGLLVINVDLRQAFGEVRGQAPPGGQVYVIGDRGDYFVHPDTRREFGFDLGRPARLQGDFPALAGALEAHRNTVELVHDRAGQPYGAALAWVRPAGGFHVGVAAIVPQAILTAPTASIRQSSLIVALAAALGAIVLAVLMARSLSRPLAQMVMAVNQFRGDGPIAMPAAIGGEIGALARAFARMAGDIRERAAALRLEIDERRRAQSALERVAATERLFLAVVESSEDAIVTKTLDGTITAWNPGAERMFGYAAKEVIGKSIELLMPADRRDEEQRILAQLRRGERIQQYETVRMRKNREEIAVSLSISPLRAASGEIVGAAKIARDVTERHAAEETFRMAVEASPSGMLMVDEAGRVILANREAERLFGYDRAELIDRSVDMLVPAAARGEHALHRAAFMLKPERRAMAIGRRLFGQRKDGSCFPIEVGLNPIERRGAPRVLAAVTDITERQRAEEALTRQTQELQRSNAELEQFAYVASHDLREPLRMVASYTELLADRYRGSLDERADKYIDYAVEGAKRMQQLVDDLLTFSRVGSQGRPLEPVDAAAVTRRVIRSLQATIAETGAGVECGDLPTVLADEIQLEQVLQNLLSNALKFHAEDRAPHVRVDAVPEDGQWVFSVADNGIGIEEQYAQRIFQIFQRLHGRREYEGSGIGLTIAKKIVERHGGAIWFTSVPGRGTTFCFSLRAAADGRRPLARASADAGAPG